MKSSTKNLLILGAVGLGALYVLPKIAQSTAKGAAEGTISGASGAFSDMVGGAGQAGEGVLNAFDSYVRGVLDGLNRIVYIPNTITQNTSRVTDTQGNTTTMPFPTSWSSKTSAREALGTIRMDATTNAMIARGGNQPVGSNISLPLVSSTYSLPAYVSNRNAAYSAQGGTGSGVIRVVNPTRPAVVNTRTWASAHGY